MTGYDTTFYDTIRPGVRTSAAVLVPILMAELGPMSVIDVGCGEGWWLAEFAKHGLRDLVGIDGPYVEPVAGAHEHHVRDLAEPLAPWGRRFDLAMALEVAEHLPPDRAATFVADLCALAPVVAFSAAIVGQGGVAHINEGPPGYWADLFAQHAYTVSGALRWRLWDDPAVENWYAQNLLIAARDPVRYPSVFDTPLAPPWHVVHPRLFDARRPR